MASRRVAPVTGGSRGIGREAALRLAADGYASAVVYAVRHEEASKVTTAITGKGGHAMAIQADIAEVVAFLAGPGRRVNGQVIYVNGGAA